MRAEILTIGDELCRGEIVDTNSSYLAGRLWDLQITTQWMTSCLDDAADIAQALRAAAARADVVICSGGLGPTEDDLTVDVLAGLGGVEAVVDDAHRQRMEAWLKGRMSNLGEQGATELTAIQLRQVRVPAGARVHANPAGLAPCFEVSLAGRPVICLPGVPRELHAIFDAHLEARLRELRGPSPEHIARRIYRSFGCGESQISQACRGVVDGVAGASIHYQVKFPETLVKLVVRDPDQAAATARLDELDGKLRDRLMPYFYGTGDESLVERVARRLREANATVATAESCTGGMIGEMLTRQPGSSAFFRGGAIVYSNEEKVRQLDVASGSLEHYGAVSFPVVKEMAIGALLRFKTDLAVAVSGVAGPDGGTPEKPVGTVWLGLAVRIDRKALGSSLMQPYVSKVRKISWPGTRDQIRTLASWWALAMIDAAMPATDRLERIRQRWLFDGQKPEAAVNTP